MKKKHRRSHYDILLAVRTDSYSPAQASAILETPARSLLRLGEKGDLKIEKVNGRTVLFSRAQVDAIARRNGLSMASIAKRAREAA